MAAPSPTTRRRLTALTGIGLGAALLIGGGTYALWTSTATFSNTQTVSSGRLEIKVPESGAVTAYDASLDRVDGDKVPILGNILAHEISLGDWRAVPGDRIALVYKVEGTLIGDNLVASLGITELSAEAAAGLSDVVSFQYQVFNLDEDNDTTPTALTTLKALPTSFGTDPLAYVQASASGQDDGADDVYADNAKVTAVGATAGATIPLVKQDGSIHIGVVLYATFTGGLENQADEQNKAIATLKDLKVTLTQVRDKDISAMFGDATAD